jgi:hypothetical protein
MSVSADGKGLMSQAGGILLTETLRVAGLSTAGPRKMVMPITDGLRIVGPMRITFRRFPAHASAYSVIERDDGLVYQMTEFTKGGTKLPHDLRHFVVERELGH